MNIFGYILIAITVLLTIFVGIKQPTMHTKLFIYDSKYEIVEENKAPSIETVVKTEEIPTMSADDSKSKIQIAMEEQEIPAVNVEVKTVEQPKTTTQVKQNTQQTTQKPLAKTTTKQVPKTTTTTKKPEEKVVVQTKPQTTQTTKTTTQPQQITQTKPQPQQTTTQTQTQPTVVQTQQQKPSQTTVKVLTQQEEEIAWNVWRSNLQNKILRDVKLPTIPMGTVFKVSFDVDKYGKITNLQTWSADSRYTPYVIEFVAPVIRSYQGKPILDFPTGSQRTKTTFTGAWKIASSVKYSSPSDYNDTERILK
ncbi:hypothetical protein IJS77_02590 [bacterium]|nr:hypothetical protein [bacterium]